MNTIKKMALNVIAWVVFWGLVLSLFPHPWPSADAALLIGMVVGTFGGFIHYKIWGLK